jgi:uncharacterized BrkB/YihY/UPF0761 family membrane protein
MDRPARRALIRERLRWGLSAIFVTCGLLFLNDAVFSLWAAGGPPTEHKSGWERRAVGSFLLFFACILGGIAVFRAVPRLPTPGRVAWLAAGAAVAFAVAPWVVRQAQIDNCLDSGGRWGYSTLECER